MQIADRNKTPGRFSMPEIPEIPVDFVAQTFVS